MDQASILPEGDAVGGSALVNNGITFDLGPDIGDQSHFLRNKDQKFTKVNYASRNVLPARKPRIQVAHNAAQDLYQVSLREWQAGIPWDLKAGNDVMCVVATGMGKPMVAVVYATLFPKNHILFVSPLNALQEEQVWKAPLGR